MVFIAIDTADEFAERVAGRLGFWAAGLLGCRVGGLIGLDRLLNRSSRRFLNNNGLIPYFVSSQPAGAETN